MNERAHDYRKDASHWHDIVKHHSARRLPQSAGIRLRSFLLLDIALI